MTQLLEPPGANGSYDPKLVVVSYSGGVQSTALAHMVLRDVAGLGDTDVALVMADPGMEDSRTYAHTERMKALCELEFVPFIEAPGPDLYCDLIQRQGPRIDNPPYWTRPRRGWKDRGQLMQKCTRHYKIRPMARAVRWLLNHLYGVPTGGRSEKLYPGIVERWVGFSAEEEHRCKDAEYSYEVMRWPLIELGWTKQDVIAWLHQIGEPVPPRSACLACFSRTVSDYREMAHERPWDWRTACKIDKAIRDFSWAGVDDECFVSPTLKPLRQLEAEGFPDDDQAEAACAAGYCFL